MSKKIQLTIAEPCHENWDNMTDVQRGKFCGSCQKQVIDFTNMSDRQLAEFFKKPSTGSVCGRFMNDQLGRELEVPKKRIPWLKYFFTIAIPAFFISKTNAQQRPKLMGMVMKPRVKDTTKTIEVPPVRKLGEVTPLEITPVKNDTITLPAVIVVSPIHITVGKVLGQTVLKVDPPVQNEYASKTRIISGIVINESGEPIPGASVFIKGTTSRILADEKGAYKLSVKTGDTLIASAIGFHNKETVIHTDNQLTIQLQTLTLEEVVVTGYNSGKTCSITMGAVATVSCSIINHSPEKMDAAENESSIKVYPNPVVAGKNLNLEIKNPEEGYYNYQFTSLSGQIVYQQQIWIDDAAKVLALDIPHVPAGTYLLSLTHQTSGKRLAAKIIIQ